KVPLKYIFSRPVNSLLKPAPNSIRLAIVPFTLTLILGKKKLTTEDLNGNIKAKHINFISPIQGNVLKLEQVEDKVFSEGLMGEGYAVEIDKEEVIAPFDGEIIMTFPTKHAYGIKRSDGVEVLIHLGIDTVELEGQGFESYVEVGDIVKQGDLIAKVDLDYIAKKGKSLVSPIIITSGQHVELVDDKKLVDNMEIIKIV
ncbi:MAG: PTS glucose transporter subunit IIA, partial [Coprobacillus sp.]